VVGAVGFGLGPPPQQPQTPNPQSPIPITIFDIKEFKLYKNSIKLINYNKYYLYYFGWE